MELHFDKAPTYTNSKKHYGVTLESMIKKIIKLNYKKLPNHILFHQSCF